MSTTSSTTRRRYFTPAELELVRARYGREPAAAIAAELGRDLASLYRLANRLGLSVRPQSLGERHGPEFVAAVQAHNAAGATDCEIAAALGVERRALSNFRAHLGLPSHGHGERVAAAAEQRVALTARMYEVRTAARRLYAERYDERILEAVEMMRLVIDRGEVDAPIGFLPWLAKRVAADGGALDEFSILQFTAATVELIENPNLGAA